MAAREDANSEVPRAGSYAALYMQEPACEINPIPAQRPQLGSAPPMSICDQDHRRVAMAAASAIAGTRQQQLDFLDSEVLAWPALRVEHSSGRYCPVFDGWRPPPRGRFQIEKSNINKRYFPIKSPFRDT
jgi:hypothetical protein